MARTESRLVSTAPRRSLRATLVGARTPLQAEQALWGYLFAIPWVLGLLVFIIGPIVASFYFSFTEYDVISDPRFIGLKNYQTALFEDKLFWPSLWRTFQYTFLVVPLGLVGSLALALLLNRGLRGTNAFPDTLLSALTHANGRVGAGLALALSPTVGPINVALSAVGIEGPAWLASSEWALPALIIIDLWASWGGSAMLIFLAGLQGVPRELHEAAEIDGASRWGGFRHITLPMLTPTILFNFVLGFIEALKVFTLAFVATKGGPSYATWFFALHIYNNAFEYFRMGYGSALAWIFVIILLVLTFIQLALSRRWVYYAGEER